MATVHYHVRCVELLVAAGAPLSNLNTVCRAAAMSTVVIQALLNRGFVVGELRDDVRATPLHHATSAEVVRMLLNVCRADVEARDCNGQTPCHYDALQGRCESMRLLIDAGADIELVDSRGRTAFHIACSSSSSNATFMLLAAGANVHARSADGRTAALFAIGRLHMKNVSQMHALLAVGADLDVPNPEAGGISVRQMLVDQAFRHHHHVDVFAKSEIDRARRRIAKLRLDFVRHRALQVCIGLQSRGLDALQICEILQFACGAVAPMIAFHQWWAIATTVKHFKRRR